MEMMPMMMDLDEFPEQFPPPFQHLPESPLMGFSRSTTNHPPPLPQPPLIRYPPPLIMQSQQLRMLRESSRGYWLQQKPDSVETMREMIFRMAALQPVQIDPESIKPAKRRNVKISSDPQTVAARHRRERISERIRILQRLVPGGTKMDTASMLDEAAHYMKFLKKQVQSLEQTAAVGGVGVVTSTPPPPEAMNITGSCSNTDTATTINYQCGSNNHSYLVRACGQPAT